MTAPKPATALPWMEAGNDIKGAPLSEHDWRSITRGVRLAGDRSYIVHACNNYPELVKTLRYALNALEGRYPWSIYVKKFSRKEARETAANAARDLLRLMGERE